MKNLEIMGVQEMNSQEMKDVDGGWVKLAIKALKYIAAVCASAFVAETIMNPDSVVDAFNEGFNCEEAGN